jgi:4'-phosphopantetheinyl transferase
VCFVDIWFEPLHNCEYCFSNFWDSLGFDERARAQRFVKRVDRKRFIISHGMLRLILASYLHLPPDKIVFATQSQGKPFVVADRSDNLKFNLSHSDSYMLLGVSSDVEIGVDVEKWAYNVDYEGVLDLCFSESERRFWQELSVDKRQAFFYRQWVRKESFTKAVGLGLGLDVSLVETSLKGASRFRSLPVGFGLPGSWSLTDLELPHGLSGAITAQSRNTPAINYKRLF